MARVFDQPDTLKTAFLQRIMAKDRAHEQSVRNRVDIGTPSFLHWALKPLATAMVRSNQRHKNQQGTRGESLVGWKLRTRLPEAWTVINDVVLEYAFDQYTQIDHIAIGPHGVFLIETKAWDGAILLKEDQCFRKEAGRWKKTASPVRQNQTHARRFGQWHQLHTLPGAVPPIHPIVVFTEARWLRAEDCSIRVITPDQLIPALTPPPGKASALLDADAVNHLTQAILEAVPLPRPERLEQNAPRKAKSRPRYSSPRARVNRSATPAGNTLAETPPTEEPAAGKTEDTGSSSAVICEGTTRAGRRYIRVEGSRETAYSVWEQHGKPGKLARDRYHPGAFFFYCD